MDKKRPPEQLSELIVENIKGATPWIRPLEGILEPLGQNAHSPETVCVWRGGGLLPLSFLSFEGHIANPNHRSDTVPFPGSLASLIKGASKTP